MYLHFLRLRLAISWSFLHTQDKHDQQVLVSQPKIHLIKSSTTWHVCHGNIEPTGDDDVRGLKLSETKHEHTQ